MLNAPEPAHASWQNQITTWAAGLNSALGKADKIFSPEVVEDLAPVGVALSVVGPLISTLFGTGQPSTSDIMDQLKKLDDIESRLTEVQNSLNTIQDEVLNVDTDVLLSACDIETSELQDFVTSLGVADRTYEDVLDEIELIRTGAETDNGALNVTVDAFITNVLGSTSTYSVSGSAMETDVLGVHNRLVSSEGSVGVIQSCGKAYYAEWRQETASSAAKADSTSTAGWADDRQYYDELQSVLRYWQTAQAHGMFLLQEATIMQASRSYTSQTQLAIGPAASTELCARASANPAAAQAKVLCRTGLKAATNFYTQIADQWKVLGMPITDDSVIMALGADVSPLPGAPAESAVWARDHAAVPADWTTSTWQGGASATPTSYAGIDGFVPAGSGRWNDLVAGYSASHPSDIAPTLATRQGWRSSDPYGQAGVAPFRPVDILSKMSGVEDSVSGGPAFTAVPGYVWIPGETGAHYFPNFYSVGPTAPYPPKQLSFPPAQFLQGQPQGTDYLVSPVSLAVRCFVAPIDGVVCGENAIASWWVANQVTQYPPYDSYGGSTGTYAVYPRSQTVPSLTIGSTVAPRPQCPGSNLLCEARPTGVIGGTPDWLADPGAGQSAQTLWPVAALPNCASDGGSPAAAVTVWGVPTRCDDQIDAWVQSTVPNPSLASLAPQASSAVVMEDNGVVERGLGEVCVAPSWQESAVYSADELVVSLATFAAVTQNGRRHSRIADDDYNYITLSDFAQEAGWSDRPDFTLTCSFQANYRPLANVTEVMSAPGLATVENGYYVFRRGTLGGTAPLPPAPGPGTPPTPTPTPTAPITPVESSDPRPTGGTGSAMSGANADGRDGTSGLADTGMESTGLVLGAGFLLLLSGLVVTLTRRYRRGLRPGS